MNVVGKYDDDSWLGPNGIRTDSSVKEWPVSYHGTKVGRVASIVGEGLKIGPGDVYGKGIYTSPSLAIADHFAGTTTEKNQTQYKCVLQSRADPKRFQVKSKKRNGCDYWISPENNAVRPYGILLKEIKRPGSQAGIQLIRLPLPSPDPTPWFTRMRNKLF